MYNSFYSLEENLLITELHGEVDLQEVERWRKELYDQVSKVEEGQIFKMLINLFGYKPFDLEAYKAFRLVLPRLLARYNWSIGYLGLLEDNLYTLTSFRGITCIAVAHVYHDKPKVEAYQLLFGKHNEHYFYNAEDAATWIRSLSLNNLKFINHIF